MKHVEITIMVVESNLDATDEPLARTTQAWTTITQEMTSDYDPGDLVDDLKIDIEAITAKRLREAELGFCDEKHCGHELHGYRAGPYVCEHPRGHSGDHEAVTDQGELSWNNEGRVTEVRP